MQFKFLPRNIIISHLTLMNLPLKILQGVSVTKCSTGKNSKTSHDVKANCGTGKNVKRGLRH